MYTFDRNDKTLPPWVHGSASLSRNQVLRLGDQVPGIESYITEIPVELITVDMLLDRITIKNPDIVIVDAEGYDAVILRQFDFTKLRPMLVLYEEDSLPAPDAAEIRQRLENASFIVRSLGQDSVAIRSDTTMAVLFGK